MSLNTTVEDFITAQEDTNLSENDINTKLSEVKQSVTIKDVGAYHHPTLLFRNSETTRAEQHLQLHDSLEEFETLGKFEYQSIEYPDTAAAISLLGFVLDDSTTYTTESYNKWLNQNYLSDEEYTTYKDWVTEENTMPLNQIYHSETDDIWHLASNIQYDTGVISPLLSLSIIFEDDAGINYVGVVPVDTHQEEVKQLFDIGLEKTETTPETTYETNNTHCQIAGDTLLFEQDDFSLSCETIFTTGWYTAPFISHALSNISTQTYDLIESLEDGWYTTTVSVDTEQAATQNLLSLETPYDTTKVEWRPSLHDEHMTKQLLSQTKNTDEIPIALRSPYSASEELVGSPHRVSETYVWVVTPIKQKENALQDTEEENNETETTDEDTTAEETENESVTETPNSILERLGF